MSDDEASAAAGVTGEASEGEEFKLLDIEGSSPSAGYRNTASAISADGEVPLGEKLSRLAFTGINTVFTCSALAVAKQLVNPTNYSPADAATQEASRSLPSWFAGEYKQRRVASDMTQRVLRDTGVLMAASGMWYGIQYALRKLRGEHDAVNVCVAGTVSAGFLGATFIEPLKWSRAGIWGAVGGLLGYYGFQEQQALRVALLERQQELEQKHFHVAADKTHQKLDPKLLQELLRLEQKARQEELRSQMNKHGIQVPASSSDSNNSHTGDSSNSSSKAADGSSSSRPDSWLGTEDAGVVADDQWQKLLSSAPWLQEEDSNK